MNCQKLIWSFIALSLLPISQLASEKIVKETIDSQGRKRAYYLFVPDSIKPDTPVPLIVMLHGSGRNGLSLVEKWKDIAGRERFIIVGPDSIDTRGWSS